MITRITSLAIFSGLVLPLILGAAIPVQEYKFEKELSLRVPAPGAMLGKVSLDEEVFGKSAPDLRDIRIVKGESEEVPFKTAEERAETIIETYAVRVLNNAFLPSVSQSFVADFGTGFLVHNRLALDISPLNKDFRRRVEVRGGNTIGEWSVLRADAIMYDYSRDLLARETSVSYPETNYRYLEITILNPGEAPLTVMGARGFRLKHTEAREVIYTPTTKSITENIETKSTDIVIDLGAPNLRVKKIQIATSSENFYRRVEVYQSGDNAAFYTHSTGVIFSYQTPKFTGRLLEVQIPEARARYLKVSILNRDDAPLVVTGATFTGLLRSLLFKYEEGAHYTLLYGNLTAKHPEYDLEHVLPYLDEGNTAMFALAPGRENKRYELPPKPVLPLTERYPHLLTIVLILVVLILGGLATRILLANKTRL